MANGLVLLADIARKVPGLQQALWRARSLVHALERALLVRRPVVDGNPVIERAILEARPFACGKMGATEAAGLTLWLARRRAEQSGGSPPDYPAYLAHKLFVNAGVFPQDPAQFDRFGGTFLAAVAACDALAAWDIAGEARILRDHCPHAALFTLRSLEPYFSPRPWSRALAGKKVLVLSPFAASIAEQHARREGIWASPEVLPEFALATVRAPLSAGLTPPKSPDWHAALELMQAQMDAADYDVALAGAGAFSLPLAAHAKARGKVGLHLGGGLQMLFGIVGQRWREHRDFTGFINEHWRSPSPEETPENRHLVEGGCYW